MTSRTYGRASATPIPHNNTTSAHAPHPGHMTREDGAAPHDPSGGASSHWTPNQPPLRAVFAPPYRTGLVLYIAPPLATPYPPTGGYPPDSLPVAAVS